jgi:hypothetical protein
MPRASQNIARAQKKAAWGRNLWRDTNLKTASSCMLKIHSLGNMVLFEARLPRTSHHLEVSLHNVYHPPACHSKVRSCSLASPITAHLAKYLY